MAHASAAWPSAPELLVVGVIHTLDPARPVARGRARARRALRVRRHASRRARASAAQDAPRLEVGSAVPGLVDAHGHVMWLGRARARGELRGRSTARRTCVARVAERARAAAAGELDPRARLGPEPLARRRRSRRRRGSRARCRTTRSSSCAWTATRRGRTRPRSPPPGSGRTRRTRRAGRSCATRAAGPPACSWTRRWTSCCERIPAPTPAEIEEALRRGLDALARLGLTAAHDAGVTPEVLDVYRRLAGGGPAADPRVRDDRGRGAARELDRRDGALAGGRRSVGRLTVRAVKLYADGALGSRGAALLEDYADDPGNRGLFLTAPGAPAREASARSSPRGSSRPCTPSATAPSPRRSPRSRRARRARRRCAALRPARSSTCRSSRRADAPRLAAAGVDRLDAADARDERRAVGPGAPRRRHRAACAAPTPGARCSARACRSRSARTSRSRARTRGSGSSRRRRALAAGARAPFLPEERLDARGGARARSRAGAAYAAFAEGRRGMIREGFDADLTAFAGDVLAVPASALAAARR